MKAAEMAKAMFDSMKGLRESVEAVAPGLNGVSLAEDRDGPWKNNGGEKLQQAATTIGKDLLTALGGVADLAYGPKGIQGAAELAQALFSQSNAYVPYGAGQQSPQSHDHQQERGGMGR